MTDPANTPEPPTTPPAEPPAATEPPTAPNGQFGEHEPYIRELRQESARYRTERNQVADERDALRARVEAADRSTVESLVGTRLHDPRDLLDRVKMDTLRGEDGSLDEAKITEQIDALVAERPHLAKPSQTHRDIGQGGGMRQGGRSEPPSFGQALKDRYR